MAHRALRPCTSRKLRQLTRLVPAVLLIFVSMFFWQTGVRAQVPDQATPGTLPARHFYAIPAGALDQALMQFVQISGSLLASTPDQVQGKTSVSVQGEFNPQEALDILLTGTGLRAILADGSRFVLHDVSNRATPEPTMLTPVTVVSAAGYAQAIKHAPASISVVTDAELQARQFSSLQDMVREVPGVAVIGAGRQSGISMRGMEKDYTLVLVDGMRVRSETGHPRELNNEDLDSNYIPPLASIARIEVIRGPMSSLYGSDAVGGIINVITKKTPETWSGSVELGLRKPANHIMGNQRQRNTHISGPLIQNLLGLSVWGNETVQDEDQYNGGYQESTKRTVGGKLRFTPDRGHDMTLNYSDASQHYANREWTRKHWAAGWNARFALGDMELKYYREDHERLVFPRNNTYTTGSTNRVADVRFTTDLGIHMLSLGAQWANDRLTNSDLGSLGNLTYGTRKTTERAVFVEDEWELLTDKLFLTGGARFTHNDLFGSKVTPRAYLVLHHNDDWTFKGGVATGYKRPKITQIDGNTASRRGGGANQFALVGNPALKPETSLNIEVSAHYMRSESFSGSVTLFHTDFDHKIISTHGHFFDDGLGGRIAAFCTSGSVGNRNCPGWGTWLNLDGAKNRGVELDGRLHLHKTLQLKGNYTYTHSRISLGGDTLIHTPAGPRVFGQTLAHLDGNSLAGIPKHNGSVALNWRPDDVLSGFIRLNYEGQLTKVSFENQTVDKNDKDLLTLDAGLTYALGRQLSLMVTIDNLTNAKRFHINQTTGAYRYAERGRSYYASIRGRF